MLIVCGTEDGFLWLVNAETGEPWRRIKAHKARVNSVAIASAIGWIASAGEDESCYIWDGMDVSRRLKLGAQENNQEPHHCVGLDALRLGHCRKVSAVTFSGGNRVRLATASRNGSVIVWNPTTGIMEAFISLELNAMWHLRPTASQDLLNLRSHQGNLHARMHKEVCCLAFSPDAWTLATGDSEGGVYLWVVIDREQKIDELTHSPPRVVFRGHWGDVLSLAYSPDCRRLASGGCDKKIKVWSAGVAPAGKCATKRWGVKKAYPSQIWDNRTGSCLRVLGGQGEITDWISAVQCPSIQPRAVSNLVRRGCHDR
jgi:WD40 repeat protein